MSARILDGKKLAQEIRAEIRNDVATFVASGGPRPTLAAVLVGEDPASQVYVRNKRKACEKAGIGSDIQRLPQETDQSHLLEVIERLNRDATTHGILVQLPLPSHLDAQSILDAIEATKDVDAFHPLNVGLLAQGRPRFLPCTPHGIHQMLYRSGIQVAGRHVVVVGRSDIVGKPIAVMLGLRDSPFGPDYANATVTLCHSRTPALDEMARQADILIAAIGRPRFITGEMIQPGAVVIDVGINRTDEGLVGDVDYAAVSAIASAITPVPGGVGPLTVAMLLRNTLRAAQMAHL